MGIRHYLHQNLLAIDQLGNTLFNGYADETLSSRAYRMSRYAFRVYWLWRNSVYGFARHPFGVDCRSVAYVYYHAEKDFLAVSDDGFGWFTPFQLRGVFHGVYVYIGWKLLKVERDGSTRKMYCIQVNPFRKG